MSKPKRDKHTVDTHIYLTPREFEEIKKQADKAERSVTAQIRFIVRQFLEART